MNGASEPDDQTLAGRALSGDRRAFPALVRRHKEPLYRFIRRYTGDSDEAYDVLQDTFTAAWTALKRYDPQRPFPTWLRSIALNKCRDWGRRRTVRRWLTRSDSLDSPAGLALPAAEPTPEAALTARQDIARLDAAVAKLPQGLKEPLILTQLEELSHEEAGKLLGLTPKAVEVRVYRARRALTVALGLDPS